MHLYLRYLSVLQVGFLERRLWRLAYRRFIRAPSESIMMKEREGNRIGKREKLGSNTASTEALGSPRRSFEDEINLRVVPS